MSEDERKYIDKHELLHPRKKRGFKGGLEGVKNVS